MTKQLTTTKLWGTGGKNFRPGGTYPLTRVEAGRIEAMRKPFITIFDDGEEVPEAMSDVTESDPRTGSFDDVDTGEGAVVLHIPDNAMGATPPVVEPEPEPAPPVVPPDAPTIPVYVCDDCGRDDFKSKASRTRHINSNHAPVPEDA